MATAAAAPSFTYNDELHEYRLADGLLVPGVTQVLEEGGVIDYSRVSSAVLDAKSDLGSAVHLACNHVYRDILDWDRLPVECVPYVNAFEGFLAETGFKADRIEVPHVATIDGMPVGLKPDYEGYVLDTPWIFDIKCAVKEEASWALQSAGYSLGRGTPPRGGAFYNRAMVQLKPDASFKLFRYTDRQDEYMFRNLLALAWWKRNKGINVERKPR